MAALSVQEQQQETNDGDPICLQIVCLVGVSESQIPMQGHVSAYCCYCCDVVVAHSLMLFLFFESLLKKQQQEPSVVVAQQV